MSSLGHLGENSNFDLGEETIAIRQRVGPIKDGDDFTISNEGQHNYVQMRRGVLQFLDGGPFDEEIIPPDGYFNIGDITENYKLFVRQRFVETGTTQGLVIYAEDELGNIYDEGQVEGSYSVTLTVDGVASPGVQVDNIQIFPNGDDGENQYLIIWVTVGDENDPDDDGVYFQIKGFVWLPDQPIDNDKIRILDIQVKLETNEPNTNLKSIYLAWADDTFGTPGTTEGEIFWKFDLY